MADTKRFQAIKNIRDKLKEITIANGYDLDLEGRVYLGKLEHGEETKTPFITLWEPFAESGPLEASSAPKQSGRAGRESVSQCRIVIKYYIQGFAAKSEDALNPTGPAYDLLGAIQKCLGGIDGESRPFGDDEEPGEFQIDWGLVRPAGDNISAEHPYTLITLNILILEERGSPYVQ
jgi:hypothetical protein